MKSFLHLILGIASTVLRGYILHIFWAWFIVTQFPQAPHLGIVPAIGMSYVMSLLNFTGLSRADYEASKEGSDSSYFAHYSAVNIIALLLTWFGGYIVHLFM
jgi:hypothetical protein